MTMSAILTLNEEDHNMNFKAPKECSAKCRSVAS